MSDADSRLPIHVLIDERKFALGLKRAALCNAVATQTCRRASGD